MNTQSWDVEALRRFPDLVNRFEGVTSMYALWNELTDAFKAAYQPPCNEDLIRRIYEFAQWCCAQPHGSAAGDDLQTCVSVCFFEEIPTVSAAIPDMPTWFSLEEIQAMRPVFSTLVGESGFASIISAYNHSNTSKSGVSSSA